MIIIALISLLSLPLSACTQKNETPQKKAGDLILQPDEIDKICVYRVFLST